MATPRKVRIDGINATFMVEADTDEQLESAIDELAAKYRGQSKGQIAQSMWAEQGLAPGGRGTSDYVDQEAKLETAPQGLWENIAADIGSTAETPGQAVRDLVVPPTTGAAAAPPDASPKPMQDFRRQRTAEARAGVPFEPVMPATGIVNPYAIEDKLTNLKQHVQRNVTEQGPLMGNAQNLIDGLFFMANKASQGIQDRYIHAGDDPQERARKRAQDSTFFERVMGITPGADTENYGGISQPFEANFRNPDGTASQRGVVTGGNTDPDGVLKTPTQLAENVPDMPDLMRYVGQAYRGVPMTPGTPRAVTKGVAGALEDFVTLENVLETAGLAFPGTGIAKLAKAGFGLSSVKLAMEGVPILIEAAKTGDDEKTAEAVRYLAGAGLMGLPVAKATYKGAKAGVRAGVKAVKDVRSVGDDMGKALAEGLADAGRTAKNPNAAASPVAPPDSSFSTGAKSDFINPLEGVVTSNVKTGSAAVRTEGQTLPIPTVAQRANLEGQVQGIVAMHPGSRVDTIDDWTKHVTLPDGQVVPVKVTMDIPVTPEVLWETNRAEALRQAEAAGVKLDPKAKFEDVKADLERVLANEQAQGVSTPDGIKLHGGQKYDNAAIEAEVAKFRDSREAENMRRPMGKRKSQKELTAEENAYRRQLYQTEGDLGSTPTTGGHEGVHTSWADVEPAVREWGKDYAKDTDPAQLEEKFAEFYEVFQILNRDGITPDMLTGDRVLGEVFPKAQTMGGGEFANVPVSALRLPLDIYNGKYGRQGTGAPAPAKLTPEQRRAAAADTAARMRPPEQRPVPPPPVQPAPAAIPYDGNERRVATERRVAEVLKKDNAELTPDDIATLRTHAEENPKSGLPSLLAWEARPRAAHIASHDLDGLKHLNDKYGENAGNAMLAAFGRVTREVQGRHPGVFSAHSQGDEFRSEHADRAALEAYDKDLRETWQKTPVVIRDGHGNYHELIGLTFSTGIDTAFDKADRHMKGDVADADLQPQSKRARQVRGERAGERGGIPPGVEARQLEGPPERAPGVSGVAPRSGYDRRGGGAEGPAVDTPGEKFSTRQLDTPEFKAWFGDSRGRRYGGIAPNRTSTRASQSPIPKSGVNSRGRNSEPAGNDFVGSAAAFHGDGFVDGPSKREVLDGVLSASQDAEVRRAVIELIPIDVVDNLRRAKLTPEDVLGDKTMLNNLLASDSAALVSTGVDVANSLIDAVAIMATESPGLFELGPARRSGERTAASIAHDLDKSIRSHVGMLSQINPIGNRGTFDPTDPDIRHSTRRLDTEYKEALKESPWLKDVEGNVGKPATVPTKYVRANAGRTPEERNLLDSFARTRAAENLPRVRHDREVVKEAKARLAKDKAGEELRLMTDVRKGATRFEDVDNVMLDMLRAERNEAARRLTGEAKRKAIEESQVLENVRADNVMEAARVLRIVRDPDESPRQRMERWFNGAVFAPKDAKTAKGLKEGDPKAMKDQVNHVEKLLEQLKKDGIDTSKWTDKQAKDPIFVAEQVRKVFARKATFSDKVYEYWANSILSGPQTQVVNMVSNIAALAWEYMPQRLLQTAVSGAITGDRVEFDSLMHAYRALLSGVAYREGIRNAAQAWKTEAGVLSQKTGGGLAFEGGGRDYPRVAIAGTKGRVIRTPFRLLKSADEFAKGVIGQMEAAASAYKIAKNEGLSGEKLGKRMHELILDYESEAWTKAVSQAELLTFQRELGKVGKKVMDFRNNVPIVRYVLPFVTTPYNIFATGVNKSPLGLISATKKVIAAAKSEPGFREAIKRGTPEGEAALRALTEQVIAMGATAMLGGTLANETVEDGLVITGPVQYDVDDRGTRDAKYRSLPPSSFVWKDDKGEVKSASYARIEPFATILGLLADGAALFREGNKKDASDLLTEGWYRFQGQLTDKTFLRGIEDLTASIRDPKHLTRWLTNFSGSWVPNVAKQPMRAADPFVRETKLWGATKPEHGGETSTSRMTRRMNAANFPTTGNPFLPPPKRNLIGQEVQKLGGAGPVASLMRLVFPVQFGRLTKNTPKELVRFDQKLLALEANGDLARYLPAQAFPYYTVTRDDGTKKRVFMSDKQKDDFDRLTGQYLWERMQEAEYFTKSGPLTVDDTKEFRDHVAAARKEAREELFSEEEEDD